MTDYESRLNRELSAGVLDGEAAARIRVWESAQKSLSAPRISEPNPEARYSRLAWQGRVALILGGILLASGIALFVSAHWDQLGPGMRYLLVMAMASVFH